MRNPADPSAADRAMQVSFAWPVNIRTFERGDHSVDLQPSSPSHNLDSIHAWWDRGAPRFSVSFAWKPAELFASPLLRVSRLFRDWPSPWSLRRPREHRPPTVVACGASFFR